MVATKFVASIYDKRNMKNDNILFTTAGTLLSVVAIPQTTEMIQTLILGALGAAGAFIATCILRYITRKIKGFYKNGDS